MNPVANKTQNQLQVKNVNFKSIFQQALQENIPTEEAEELGTWEVTNSAYFTDLGPALKAIDAKLQEYKAKFKGATIVALQSDVPAAKLQFMGLPSLVNEFPVLKLRQTASDNEFPALDWVRFAAKNMSFRFYESL